MQAWTRWPVCPLYGQPQDTPEESGVVDEALLGMPVTVTGPQQGSRVPVRLDPTRAAAAPPCSRESPGTPG